MASLLDDVIPVEPDTDETFRLDCSSWETVRDGDTVASGSLTWNPSGTHPTTTDAPTASTPADQYLNFHLAGFTASTNYFCTVKVTTTGGAVRDFYLKFVCATPTSFA